jgi:uncharacterized repeat protein (TIGR03803 family)
MLAAIGTLPALAQTYTYKLLYSFAGEPADGSEPSGSLIRDSAGNLYGTTFNGGAYGQGTIFKVDTTGTETVLYSFTGEADGAGPCAGVIRDSAGNLDGTADGGGIFTGTTGYGVVFELDASGAYTVLHSFTGVDGAFPEGG